MHKAALWSSLEFSFIVLKCKSFRKILRTPTLVNCKSLANHQQLWRIPAETTSYFLGPSGQMPAFPPGRSGLRGALCMLSSIFSVAECLWLCWDFLSGVWHISQTQPQTLPMRASQRLVATTSAWLLLHTTPPNYIHTPLFQSVICCGRHCLW